MPIRMIEKVCPNGHLIYGAGYDPAHHNVEFIKKQMQAAADAFHVDPWCLICKSRDLEWNDWETEFETIPDAQPYVQKRIAEEIRQRDEFLEKQEWPDEVEEKA